MYRHPMLSDLGHRPFGIDASQEKLAMKTQPIKDDTNCPSAHQTERRVKVHYSRDYLSKYIPIK
jgi:hypothetical protein